MKNYLILAEWLTLSRFYFNNSTAPEKLSFFAVVVASQKLSFLASLA